MALSDKKFEKYFGMSKADWERGVRALNSTWSQENSGLPNRFQVTEWEDEMYAHRFDKEFASLDFKNVAFDKYNTGGYTMFLALIYEKFSNFVGSIFNYDGLMDELGISKYKFEKMLIENGSLAIVKDGENYLALPYQPTKFDVYECPTQIKTISTKSKRYNGKVFEKDEFQIIKQNQNGWNKIVENGVWLSLAYKTGCEINDEIMRGQNHYIKLSNRPLQGNGQVEAQALDQFSRSSETFMSVLTTGIEKHVNGDPTSDALNTEFDDWAKSLLKLEYRERLDVLWETFQNLMAEAFKYLGWDVNMNAKKKERQITGEIEVQQQIPLSQRIMMLELREWALEQCNKKWGTSWGIELNDRIFDSEKDSEETNEEEE